MAAAGRLRWLRCCCGCVAWRSLTWVANQRLSSYAECCGHLCQRIYGFAATAIQLEGFRHHPGGAGDELGQGLAPAPDTKLGQLLSSGPRLPALPPRDCSGGGAPIVPPRRLRNPAAPARSSCLGPNPGPTEARVHCRDAPTHASNRHLHCPRPPGSWPACGCWLLTVRQTRQLVRQAPARQPNAGRVQTLPRDIQPAVLSPRPLAAQNVATRTSCVISTCPSGFA